MGLLQLVAASVTEKMYGIVPWSVEAIAVVLAIVIVFLTTLLCMARSRSYGVKDTDVLSLRTTDVDCVGLLNFNNLCAELKTVNDWHQLGINLHVPADDLTEIERSYKMNHRQRAAMLDLWLRRTPNAVWKDVVDALQQMGENRVAENIRQKYIRGGSKLPTAVQHKCYEYTIECWRTPEYPKMRAGST